ncbi:MAG: hypothetical protein NTY55_12690 [Flavobacteriia bacterium]|nr:hypothetical protein [Flavobacteriia bacterium]
MKNLFILTVFALIALTSCKKDYTCECKDYEDGVMVLSESTTIKDTKSKAKTSCDELDDYEDLGGYIYETKCEIK